jgi:hypothetical protein
MGYGRTPIVFEKRVLGRGVIGQCATRSEPHRLALGAPVAAEKRVIFNGLAGKFSHPRTGD